MWYPSVFGSPFFFFSCSLFLYFLQKKTKKINKKKRAVQITTIHLEGNEKEGITEICTLSKGAKSRPPTKFKNKNAYVTK